MGISDQLGDLSSSELTPSRQSLPPLQLALILCWAGVVLCAGGFGAGLAIAKFGTLGAASLWLVGEAAGSVGRKLVLEKSKLAGAILVVACVGAFVLSEVCWLHWTRRDGAESWLAAIKLLPAFVRIYTLSAVIGAVFCFIGAQSAYRRVARRYRIVHVVEE